MSTLFFALLVFPFKERYDTIQDELLVTLLRDIKLMLLKQRTLFDTKQENKEHMYYWYSRTLRKLHQFGLNFF